MNPQIERPLLSRKQWLEERAQDLIRFMDKYAETSKWEEVRACKKDLDWVLNQIDCLGNPK